MASPMISVVKRLFARCQNRCAHTDCVAPIVEDSGTTVEADVERYPAPVLTEMKRSREQVGVFEISPETARVAEGLPATHMSLTVHSNSGHIAVNSLCAVQANTLTLKVTKHKVSVAAPAGSVGSDQAMISCVTYLINRYQEFQKGHTGKASEFRYIALHTALRRELKGDWKLLPSAKFEVLVEFLHRRTDNTFIARRNSAKGVASYHLSFEHG